MNGLRFVDASLGAVMASSHDATATPAKSQATPRCLRRGARIPFSAARGPVLQALVRSRPDPVTAYVARPSGLRRSTESLSCGWSAIVSS